MLALLSGTYSEYWKFLFPQEFLGTKMIQYYPYYSPLLSMKSLFFFYYKLLLMHISCCINVNSGVGANWSRSSSWTLIISPFSLCYSMWLLADSALFKTIVVGRLCLVFELVSNNHDKRNSSDLANKHPRLCFLLELTKETKLPKTNKTKPPKKSSNLNNLPPPSKQTSQFPSFPSSFQIFTVTLILFKECSSIITFIVLPEVMLKAG